MRHTLRLLLPVSIVLAGCGAATGAATGSAPDASGSPLVSPAPATNASSGSDGSVIHVNLFVPLTSATPAGSLCGATNLQATGPIAATIPGATFSFLEPNPQFTEPPAPETEQPADGGSSAPSEPGSHKPNQSIAIAPFTIIGGQTVPEGGTVAAALSTDANYPTSCKLAFNVAIARTFEDYFYEVGKASIAMPVIPSSQLEGTGWIANIGINPQ